MATQESTLRVGIDSRPAEQGAKRAKKALKDVGNEAEKTEKDFKKMGSTMGAFGKILGAISIGLVAREFMQLSDAATTISNRLRLVTNNTEELNAVYGQLLKISNETRTSIGDNADIFNRLAIATQSLNLTYREQLDLTRRLNQALVISGASAQEGSAALRQLGQALGAGALRADEYISVNENLPRLMQAIADSMGVPRGALKDLSKDGAITSAVIVKAMKDAGTSLDEEFAKIDPTIGGSFTVLQNKLLDFVKTSNEATGISAVLSKAIFFVSDNFNAFAAAALAAATILGGVLLTNFLRMSLAFAASPFGAMVVAVSALIVALGFLGDKTFKVGDQQATGWQIAQAALITAKDYIVDGIATIRKWLGELEKKMQPLADAWKSVMDFLGLSTESTGSFIVDILKFVINSWIKWQMSLLLLVTDGWGAIGAAIEYALSTTVNAVLTMLDFLINGWSKGLAAIAGIADSILGTSYGKKIADSLTIPIGRLDVSGAKATMKNFAADLGAIWQTDYLGNAFGGLAPKFSENLKAVIDSQVVTDDSLLDNMFGGGNNKPMAEAADDGKDKKATKDKGPENFAKYLEDLRREAQLLQMTSREAEIANGLFEARDALGKKLSVTQAELVTGLLLQNQAFAEQAQVLDELRGPQQDLDARLQAIDALFGAGKINMEEYSRLMRQMTVDSTALGHSLEDGIANGLARIAQEVDNVASKMSGNLVSTYQSLTGETENLKMTISSLNTLLAEGVISWEQYGFALLDVQARGFELENSLDGGLKAGLARVALEAKSLGTGMSQVVQKGFGAAADAIVNFAATGKLAFGDLVASILKDLLKLATQQLFAKLAGSFLGGGLPGFKTGGSFEVGGSGGPDSQLVAFKATPGEKVDISTPAQQKSGGGGGGGDVSVPLKVINVLDPSIVESYLGTSDGERMILNVIERNPTVVRGLSNG
jgi:tape measure domain-containing protein